MQRGTQAHTNGIHGQMEAKAEHSLARGLGSGRGEGRRGATLDGAFVVQAVIGLVVSHTVLFIEQVGRLIWQTVVQVRKSQFNFSVFTV